MTVSTIFSAPHFNAAASNVLQTMKASPGVLTMLEVKNPNAADAYLQLFDHASPTVGVTTPVLSFHIPASGAIDKLFGNAIEFAVAIKYAVTTTPTGSTAPAAALNLNAAFI